MSATMRNGFEAADPRLGRLPSETTEHLERYPLTSARQAPSDASAVFGINWYRGFSDPEPAWIGSRYVRWIGRGSQSSWGPLDGGHAICARHHLTRDVTGWWRYYDQGDSTECTMYAALRAASHHHRRRFSLSPVFYYDEQCEDEWPGGEYPGAKPSYGGSSVRAALQTWRLRGLILDRRAEWTGHDPANAAYRDELRIPRYLWITQAQGWDMVREVLGVPASVPGVPLNNSWGDAYPHEVRITDEAGERLMAEDAEIGVPIFDQSG